MAQKHFAPEAPTPAFERVDSDLLIEEETMPSYRPERFYPVHIGQIFRDQYQIIGKLGWGAASTVWLCRDLHTKDNYVVLKVYINSSKVHRELPIYEHIRRLDSEHDGRDRIRKLLGKFEVQGPHGTHICLVHEPLGLSLAELRDSRPERVLSTAVMRETFRWILRGLEFLHQEAHVIHTDLHPHNIFMGIQHNSILVRFEQDEAESPCPRKELEDRTIYISRPMRLSAGLPAISDLSEARFGDFENIDDIMPDVYRAPEVILGLNWSYPVDIWALGMVIWDLFEGNRLFPARNPDKHYSERYHLAQMVAILGPPPLELLRRSEKSRKFWDQDGKWICDVPIPDISLESLEHRLEGQEKDHFLQFMRKMLQWNPERRGTCHDIFWDEWLLADLIASGKLQPPKEA
ncbi:protein kinase [Myriangium duriaei CBS 260.36]|uniref:non-specific serine/threonine protein kinase n=1 Tax=Myriangium duriaei CBS 260.36 TaxID=1168546 RepID=A0A9P4IYK6_9PEZI|nr:protein kinase [Myriangium duriaei CBS 260.36]